MAAYAVGDLGYVGDFMPGGRLGCTVAGEAGISVQIGGMAILAGLGSAVVEWEGMRLAEFRRSVSGGSVACGAVGAKQALVEDRVGVAAHAGGGRALEHGPARSLHVTFITIYLLVRPGQGKS